MADPDPRAEQDLSATRLRPSDWRTRGTPATPSSRRGSSFAWLLVLLLAVPASALLLVPGLAPRLQQAIGLSTPQATTDADAAALRARITELEARLQRQPPPPSREPAVQPPPAPLAPPQVAGASAPEVARLAEGQEALGRRLDALVADLDSAGVTSGAAAMAVAQARDFALLAAVRRNLDVGRPLGRLEPLLRAQFEGRDPPSVNAILAWSRVPVSAALLAEQLDRLGRPAATIPADDGFWAGLWARLSGIVEVRQGETLAPSVRRRSLDALTRGDIGSAIAVLEAAPDVSGKARWVAEAQRLLAARDALDRLDLMLLELVAGPQAMPPPQSAPPLSSPPSPAAPPAAAAPPPPSAASL